MTIEDFLNTVEAMEWRQSGWSRHQVRDVNGRCPLCAVLYETTGRAKGNDDFIDAGAGLGLPTRLCKIIADAADRKVPKEGCQPKSDIEFEIRRRIRALIPPTAKYDAAAMC